MTDPIKYETIISHRAAMVENIKAEIARLQGEKARLESADEWSCKVANTTVRLKIELDERLCLTLSNGSFMSSPMEVHFSHDEAQKMADFFQMYIDKTTPEMPR